MATIEEWEGRAMSWEEQRERVTRSNMDRQVEMVRSLREQARQNIMPMFYTSSTRGWDGNMMSFPITNSGRAPSQKETAMAASEIKNIAASAKPIAVKEAGAVEKKVSVLKELGFDHLHKAVESIAERAMKENLIGIAGYTKISREAYRKAAETIRSNSGGGLRLELTPVARYLGQHADEGSTVEAMSLPPTEVLEKMAVAKKEGLFDQFAIIHVQKAPDPILVGTVKGSEDMYFIAEWGDDIKLADIVG